MSELEACNKFLLATCGCTLADGKPCSTLFLRKYFIDTRAQSFLLSRDQLDMLLLGSVASTIGDDDDVGVRSGHKAINDREQQYHTCTKGKGYHVCRNTFTLPVSYRTFWRYWLKRLSHIVIGKPRSDLCWTCQQKSMAIMNLANASDHQKQ